MPLGGTPRLYTDLRVQPADRPGRGCSPSSRSRSATRRGPRYPLLLNTGRTVEHWHTRTKTGRIADPRRPLARGVGRDAPRRRRRASACAAGDWVRVASSAATIERIRAAGHARSCGAGEVFIPFHWDERCANRLTDDEFDPISREPNYKQCAVRVERLRDEPDGQATRPVMATKRCPAP